MAMLMMRTGHILHQEPHQYKESYQPHEQSFGRPSGCAPVAVEAAPEADLCGVPDDEEALDQDLHGT